MITIPSDRVGSPDDESKVGLDLDDAGFEKIKELYESQVVIPETKPAQQFFLCPIGLVGAGKSTVIVPLAAHFGLVRISTDEIRKMLKEHGYNWVRTADLGFAIIRDYALPGYSIAIDADCAGLSIEKTINEFAFKIGAKAIWIHIAPPEDFIVNKLTNFNHTWLFADAADALSSYHRRKPLHENLTMPFAYTFDTSKPDLPEQIKKAEQVIEGILSGA